jgi:hypothetical protein
MLNLGMLSISGSLGGASVPYIRSLGMYRETNGSAPRASVLTPAGMNADVKLFRYESAMPTAEVYIEQRGLMSMTPTVNMVIRAYTSHRK